MLSFRGLISKLFLRGVMPKPTQPKSDACDDCGSKLAKVTKEEQADLDWLNSV